MKNNIKKIVVIGGAGRLGRAFVNACMKENMDVYVLDSCDKIFWEKLKIMRLDVLNLDSVVKSGLFVPDLPK